jgi:hypothetical protein
MKYRASYDRFVITISTAIILFLVGISYLILKNHPRNNYEIAIMVLVLIFLISIPIFTFLFSPRGYLMSKEEIMVVRSLKSILIRFDDIIDISIPDEKIMKYSGRSGGVGGLFGFYGNFYNKKFGGDMTWYATQLKKFVIIKAKKTKSEYTGPNSKKIKVIVLTPDNNLEFFEDLKAKLDTKNPEPSPS